MNIPSRPISIDPELLLYEDGEPYQNSSDPYVYENGVLINRYGIMDSAMLENLEKEILAHKVISTEKVDSDNLDYRLLKSIHQYIFAELYDWAGEFRTVPLWKGERVFIPGLSIDYTHPKKIRSETIHAIADLNAVRWGNLTLDEISLKFAIKLAELWRVHPFRDGNTRAIMGFAKIYAQERGFPMNMSYFTEILSPPKNEKGEIIGFSLRNMFVGACLDEFPEPKHLASVIRKAITAYTFNEQAGI